MYCDGLTSITIPSRVTNIGKSAFYDCSRLTSITIPSSVAGIGECAFSGCIGLTSMVVDNNNKVYDSRNECNAIIRKSDDRLIAGCKKTKIPDTVTSIGKLAFENCSSLTSVIIPSSVKNISSSAFSGCYGLASIVIDANNKVYDSRNKCNAIIETSDNTLIIGCKKTTIPNTVTSIGKDAFVGCFDLTGITIPNSVTSIGDTAFSGCSGLKSITIPNSVTDIGDAAFETCSSLTSITLPDSILWIGEYTFNGCSGLKSVTIPNSVTTIGKSAFCGCSSLQSITIPSSVLSIGTSAFEDCISLKSIEVPSSVTSIAQRAFGYYYDDGRLSKVDSFTICGYSGSKAEKYAKDNDFKFKTLYTKYTVKFDGNGATSGSMTSVTCERGKNYTIKSNAYKRTGYTFNGWNTKKDGSGKDYSDKATIKNICARSEAKVTLYAQWKINKYKIIYKLNGGKNNTKNPASYKVTTSDIILKTPSRTGYTFKGWYTDSKFTKKISIIKKGSTGNKTVYAKWAANKYTIKYNSNGGTGSMKNQSMTYDKKAKLTKNSFNRKGYTFLGWSTDKKATKAKYKNQVEVSNLTNKSGDTVTLYAVWKKK